MLGNATARIVLSITIIRQAEAQHAQSAPTTRVSRPAYASTAR